MAVERDKEEVEEGRVFFISTQSKPVYRHLEIWKWSGWRIVILGVMNTSSTERLILC